MTLISTVRGEDEIKKHMINSKQVSKSNTPSLLKTNSSLLSQINMNTLLDNTAIIIQDNTAIIIPADDIEQNDQNTNIEFLGFSCNVNEGCETFVLPKTYIKRETCANQCKQYGANAASFVNPEAGGCLNCYGVNVGECICYKNAYYTSDTQLNTTYIDMYQLFRI